MRKTLWILTVLLVFGAVALAGCSTSGQEKLEAVTPAIGLAAPATVDIAGQVEAAVQATLTAAMKVAEPTATATKVATPTSRPLTDADVPRIGAVEAIAKVRAGQAIFVDARDRASYENKHVAGALAMPQKEVATRYGELPTDKEVIFYCT